MAAPVLDQINLVCRDMEVTLTFYRALGVDIPEEAIWRTASGPHHAEVTLPGGLELAFDSEKLAATYNQGWAKTVSMQSNGVIGFRVSSREEVEQLYEELNKVGYSCSQPPYDTFWGSRYAIFEDPDGRHVGIMSPPDSNLRQSPPDI
ncbi:MAG: VOC family protein [Pseudomonadota bacterium]